MSACADPAVMRSLQLKALQRMWRLACGNHGACRVAAGLLLGLYNGNRFKFDLTDLRLLDTPNFNDALLVLALDWQPQREVHEWLNLIYGVTDMGQRFEHLAHDWRLPGRCKKEHLGERPALLDPDAKTLRALA